GFGDLADRANDVAHIADPLPALEVLGWRPTTSLTQGLTQTVHWHLTRHDADHEWAGIAGESQDDVRSLLFRLHPRGRT
ncbi:MAG TPA: hypothetical protein VD789_06395, partial [Thermomicrobiales bacterium]|nr:hypothetical protein [Thermomicrobiales bacterium]